MLYYLTHNATQIPVVLESMPVDGSQEDRAGGRVQIGIEVSDDNTLVIQHIQLTLMNELSTSYGYYGHILDLTNLTNADLLVALTFLPSFTLDETALLDEDDVDEVAEGEKPDKRFM